ncbi:MAG TPA: hypothetical protein VHZ96_26335 [Frankiaceae bacterium]|nr:hypothetical protein [Frankiaceae bacterium]
MTPRERLAEIAAAETAAVYGASSRERARAAARSTGPAPLDVRDALVDELSDVRAVRLPGARIRARVEQLIACGRTEQEIADEAPATIADVRAVRRQMDELSA